MSFCRKARQFCTQFGIFGNANEFVSAWSRAVGISLGMVGEVVGTGPFGKGTEFGFQFQIFVNLLVFIVTLWAR